jgi:hypothetical protein
LPTSFVGLTLFVVLLAPGMAFLLVGERGRVATRETSVLRETAMVALNSLVFDVLAVLFILQLPRWRWAHLPDLDAWTADGSAYARKHYQSLSGWFVGAVLLACVLAMVWAAILNRTERLRWLRQRPPVRWMFPKSGTEHVSAWWKVLIEENDDTAKRRVTCCLDDGSEIQGMLLSLNPSVQETPDREITLSEPLVFTDSKGNVRNKPHGAATVSAARISYMYVEYIGL